MAEGRRSPSTATQLDKYGTHLSGFVVVAHTPGYRQKASFPLPLDLRELKLELSDTFGLQLASVSMRTWCAVSAGAPDLMWAELSSQDDLVAAMEELNEAGMHQLSLEVRGRSSVRALEALSGGLGLLATAAWLWWTALLVIKVPASEWAGSSARLALVVLVANGLVAAAVMFAGGTELSAWLKRRWPLVPLTPLAPETFLLLSSGAGGCAAPLPSHTRRALLLWGSVVQLGGRGVALYVLQAAMAGDEAAAIFSADGVLSLLPMQCVRPCRDTADGASGLGLTPRCWHAPGPARSRPRLQQRFVCLASAARACQYASTPICRYANVHGIASSGMSLRLRSATAHAPLPPHQVRDSPRRQREPQPLVAAY